MSSAQPERGEGPFILENSDGCSALSLPYRYVTKLITGEEKRLHFLDHCIEHDESYWYGGTKMQRLDADLKLFYGVAGSNDTKWTVVPHYTLASLMFIVARVMGSPSLPTPFRWMYSETYHKKITYTEEAVVKNETVVTVEDSDMVKNILENPYTSPVAPTVSDAVEIFAEGTKRNTVSNLTTGNNPV